MSLAGNADLTDLAGDLPVDLAASAAHGDLLPPPPLVPGTVVPYLMRRGLLSKRSVVEGDLTVLDLSRRNRNILVLRRRAPSYLIKQAIAAEEARTIIREAAVYRLLRRSASGLACYLPRSYGYDARARLLILEAFPEARSLLEHQLRSGRFSVRLAARLGAILGCLHRLAPAPRVRADPVLRPRLAPWVLSIHRPRPGAFRHLSGGNVQLIRSVQESADLCVSLDRLREEWRPTSLVHNDVKPANCLVLRGPGGRRAAGLKLVDWELAGLGDPAWDLGSAFAAYLALWLRSIPFFVEEPPERLVEIARYRIDRMQPAMKALWGAYVRCMKWPARAREEQLRVVVRYAAARLIQAAFEHDQFSSVLTAPTRRLLQVAINVMSRPRSAAVHLLGVRLPWSAA